MLVYPLFIVGSRLHHLNEMSCDAFKFAPCAIPVFRSVAAVHNFMRFGAKNFAALQKRRKVVTVAESTAIGDISNAGLAVA